MTKHARTAAILATAAASIALAPVAVADTQMSGHYIRTAVNRESGGTMTTHWYATPCGQGCASIEICANDKHERCGTAKASLVDGRWDMQVRVTLVCTDQNGNPAGEIPGGAIAHYTWDPNTLAGVAETDADGPECPAVTSAGTVNDFQLKHA
ncbi:Uncharacterised protein [Mycobacteroides abscessus subsp. abscessus]|uniref:hypothetical protein n=1 Tax=Mycobacteroides abscessus TaxID=36809 RepID=UPI0009A836CF|nr:hypothetical protein [Mycobacteroides abscessus]SLD05548.1 Uncharacterised protein [Mycobacteroides abscessus subsp. abscessus]SLH59919.1 Uncharacterised protein [Mycobacteroides abscessus subsp. abscessus]SLH80559.1 Uncharacterised protein [Mycobacteroides abscessus subsp. abscessus]